MANVITKAQKFTAIADFFNANGEALTINGEEISVNDVVEFLNHEAEMTTKRNSSKGMTKTQKENEPIKATIVEILGDADTGMTVKELIATDELSAYTPQKISSLLTQLRKEKKVRRDYNKKVAYFSLGSED